MNVYLVEIGEYSSAFITAAYSESRIADAERHAALLGGRVLEIVLDPDELGAMESRVPPGAVAFFDLYMQRDGNVSPREIFEYSLLGNSYSGDDRAQEYEVRERRNRPSKWRLHVKLYASSEEYAVKVANEIRSQVLAGSKPPKGPIS